jgi:hypothetical protein
MAKIKRKTSCLIANEEMGWPKLQNNCTTLGVVWCKYRERVPEHDQQEKTTSKTTNVKLLVQQSGGNSLSNKKGMGDEALNMTSLSVLFLKQNKVQP